MRNLISIFKKFQIENTEYLLGGRTVRGTVEGSRIDAGVTYMDIVWEEGPPDCGTGVYAPPGGDSANDSAYIGGTCYKEV